MIQGLITRPKTDTVIRAFVESAKGTLHNDQPNFNSLNYEKSITMFGVLRGTGEVIKKCLTLGNTFYYFDHAYLFKEQRHGNNLILNDRIYRLTKNNYSLTYIDELTKQDMDKILPLKKHIQIKPYNKNGKHILILPPSEHMKHHYNIDKNDWEKNIIQTLKKYTDRELRIRKKTSTTPFEHDIRDCWAIVSYQSTAAIDGLLNGIPSFCDIKSCALPVSLTDLSLIEKPLYAERENWLNSLLANQYTLSDIKNGYAYNRLKNK